MTRGCLINSRLRANEKLTSRGADDKPRGTRTTNRERCKRGERKVNEALTKKKRAMGKEGRRCKKGWCDK
ncbi:hypothetical protein ETF27_01735 [Prevotella brunnea]|uniref:Uncharacterized protein n=1 Tax=Prevotella brunnea TaxID=2508867 RepID=A0A5C8GLW3_9BACT|nr:hypothetical protein ETF27_01735 [Prevotella brunnea]